ncbi:19445_t:CDS:2, partial [Racocetra fulgida]
FSSPNITAIIDTGSSVMFVPPNDTAAIHEQIPGAVLNNLIFLPRTGTDCISAIVPQEFSSTRDVWIVGQTFLKNVYSVYDVENRRVGFA